MEKAGQITIFIIIAIVIVGIVVLFFMLKGNLSIDGFSSEAENVKLFIDNCIENIGKEVIYNLGQGGGYFFPPKFSTQTGIPYYYYNNKSYVLSKKQMEQEISFIISEKLFFCTKNFVNFPNLNIVQNDVDVETIIMDDKVILNVNYPISITKGDSIIIIEDFETEISVRLGVIYDTINQFIQEQLISESVCLNCILKIALNKNINIKMIDYDEESTIFSFEDSFFEFNNRIFEFVFANRYDVSGSKQIEVSSEIVGDNNLFAEGINSVVNLSYDENQQTFINAEDSVELNGVRINTFEEENILVFFDGKKHEDILSSYISFGAENLIAVSVNGSITLNFLEDNSLLDIESGDSVVLQIKPDSKVEIKKREELIPLVIVKGDFVFDEGYKSIYNNEGNLFVTKFPLIINNSKDSTTSPVELVVLNNKGYSLPNNDWAKKGYVVFVDNFNKVMFGVPKIKMNITDFEDETQFFREIKYNFLDKKDIMKLIDKNIKFIGGVSEGEEQIILRKLIDYWKLLTDETKNSIKSISFVENNYFNKYFENRWRGKDVTVVIAFASKNKEVTFRADNQRFTLHSFRHELAHERYYDIDNNYKKTESSDFELIELLNLIKNLEKDYSKNMEIYFEDRTKENGLNLEESKERLLNAQAEYYLFQDELSGDLFEEEWKKIAGEVYGVISVEEDSGLWIYEDGTSSEQAKEGVLRAYGASKWTEDFPIFAEKIDNSLQFRTLTNLNSEEYDVRYEKKLELLRKYKFILGDDYNKILEGANVI